MLASPNVKPLLATDELMLRVLARLRFATAEQLGYWLPLDAPSSVRRCAQRLEAARFIEINTERKPFVYRLSRMGCAVMGQRYFRRWHSASAMQQVLLRNQVELRWHQADDRTSVVDRTALTPLGLHAAHAEHAFMRPGQSHLFQLVVIDDYLMQSDRIAHKWTRGHLKQSRHAADTTLKRWCDVCDAYWIFAVTPLQVRQHEAYLAQWLTESPTHDEVNVTPVVEFIEPIWGVSH